MDQDHEVSVVNPVPSTLNFANQEETNSPNIVRQWVSRVISFSSQYNEDTWSANKIIGPPLVYPNYGDLQNAWAQASDFHANHFIELEFPEEVYVTKLNIYETYHAGSVVRIKIKNPLNDDWKLVWESAVGPISIETSRIFSPDLKKTLFKTKCVRLDIDCTAANSFCEIDAVELVGKKFQVDPVSVEKTLANNFKKLLQSEEFSDCVFEVNGVHFKAHRNILAVRSNHFRSILCDNLKEDRLSKPIHIENVTPDAFKALLNYFYTSKLDNDTNCTIACELMRLSEWYDLPDLSTTAFNHIKTQLDVDNIIDLIICAHDIEPKLEECEQLCLKFIAKNFTHLYNRQDFKKLSQPILVKIAQYYAQFQE